MPSLVWYRGGGAATCDGVTVGLRASPPVGALRPLELIYHPNLDERIRLPGEAALRPMTDAESAAVMQLLLDMARLARTPFPDDPEGGPACN